jgi:hypothetical protein
MSITKGQFRWLVTASLVAAILGFVASLAGESSLPAPLQDYLAAQSKADLTVHDLVILAVGIPLVIAGVVSVIGLYCFWRIAPTLTVIVWTLALILGIILGPTVEPASATSLNHLSTLLSGVILAVIYFTPAKLWFEKPKIQSGETGEGRPTTGS